MLFIFDMGGVVTNSFNMEQLYSKLHISQKVFFYICRQLDVDIWNKLETGKMTSLEFWNEFSKRINYIQRANIDGLDFGQNIISEIDWSLVPEINSDFFRLYFHPSKNMRTIELIKNLKKKHRVVCGTNTIQSHWENHMERGDYAFFNQTYASNKIGFAKPDPEFFRLILEAENFAPEEAFFTDDKIENCEAARSVGINAVHFTDADSLFKQWSQYF